MLLRQGISMIGLILCMLVIVVVLLVWLVVGLAVKRFSKMQRGRGVITTFAVAAILIPAFADEIIGGYQFRGLCHADEGLEVDVKKINRK